MTRFRLGAPGTQAGMQAEYSRMKIRYYPSEGRWFSSLCDLENHGLISCGLVCHHLVRSRQHYHDNGTRWLLTGWQTNWQCSEGGGG